jgi:hypothetical protein
MKNDPLPFSITQTMPCGGMGDLSVDFVSDEVFVSDEMLEIVENVNYNVADLIKRWEVVWPRVEAALLREIRDYDHEDILSECEPLLSVTIPEERWHKGSEWSITLSFEPFAGEWQLSMSGKQKIVECSVAF